MINEIKIRPHHVLNLVGFVINPYLADEEIRFRSAAGTRSAIAMKNITEKIRDDTSIILVPSIDDICNICTNIKNPKKCGAHKNDKLTLLPIRYRFAHYDEKHPFSRYRKASADIEKYFTSLKEFQKIRELEATASLIWDTPEFKKNSIRLVQQLYPNLPLKIRLKPHHIARFHRFLNGIPLGEVTPYELDLYRKIRDDPNVQIQVVEGLDDICDGCTKDEKSDEYCLGDPAREEKMWADGYNLEMREEPYSQAEFLEQMRSGSMWEIVNKMDQYTKRKMENQKFSEH